MSNAFIRFFINGSHGFNNGPIHLPRNPSDCNILDNWVFETLISNDELFAKASRRFSACLLVNDNSCGKLILSSELPIIFDNNLKTTFVLLFIADFNLSSR